MDTYIEHNGYKIPYCIRVGYKGLPDEIRTNGAGEPLFVLPGGNLCTKEKAIEYFSGLKTITD